MASILLIEDDHRTAEEIAFECRRAGFSFFHVATVRETLATHDDISPDLLIVDRQLPDGEGLDLIAALRSRGSTAPALVLSALGALGQRVEGLRAGCDDYLPKPFALVELMARIEALLRRPADPRQTRLTVGPFEIDRLSRLATRSARDLGLRQREFDLLAYFMLHRGQTVTRSMILCEVWEYNFEPKSNIVDVHMGRLRHKLAIGDERDPIDSVRHEGYRFDVPY